MYKNIKRTNYEPIPQRFQGRKQTGHQLRTVPPPTPWTSTRPPQQVLPLRHRKSWENDATSVNCWKDWNWKNGSIPAFRTKHNKGGAGEGNKSTLCSR